MKIYWWQNSKNKKDGLLIAATFFRNKVLISHLKDVAKFKLVS